MSQTQTSLRDSLSTYRSPQRSRARRAAAEARRQREDETFGGDVPESRRGSDVLKDQKRKVMGKVALVGAGVVLAASVAWAALHGGIDGTEEFQRAQNGDIPAKVDAANARHDGLDAAHDAGAAPNQAP